MGSDSRLWRKCWISWVCRVTKRDEDISDTFCRWLVPLTPIRTKLKTGCARSNQNLGRKKMPPNQSAAANSRRAFRLRVAGDLRVAPALHRRSPAAVAELGR